MKGILVPQKIQTWTKKSTTWMVAMLGILCLATVFLNSGKVVQAESVSTEALGIQKVETYDMELNDKDDESILADDDLKLKLLQRTLVKRVGYDKLVEFAGKSDKNVAMLEWLFENLSNLEKYLLGGTPEGGEDKYITSLEVLSKLYKQYGDDLKDEKHGETFRTMMMAISLAYGSPVNGWQTANDNKKSPWITDNRTPSYPEQRYAVLKRLLTEEIKFDDVAAVFDAKTFEDLEVEEMRWVVNNRISDPEIAWLNWYTQKVAAGKTGYGAEGYMNPYNYIYYDGGFNWYYEDQNYYQLNSDYCALDKGNLNKIHSLSQGYERGMNCNDKYGLKYFDLETAESSPLRLWTIWEEDGVCGSIAGVGTNIQMAYGIPSSLVSQPGHAAYFQSEQKDFEGKTMRFWSINNNCGNWSNSYKGERMPLNWGTRIKNTWTDSNNASYLIVAQRALDNYDDMQNSFYYVWLADMHDDLHKKINSYESAIAKMTYNIDAWYALTQIAKNNGEELSLDDEKYFEFAEKIMDDLKEFPLPMYDLLKQIMDKMGARQVAYVKKLDNTLDELSKLKAASGPYFQTQATIDLANYILGRTGDTDIAEFSFDGEQPNTLSLVNGPRTAKTQFEYSFDTDLNKYGDKDLISDEDGVTWYNVTDGQVDVDLTVHREEINDKNKLLVHLFGTKRTKENIFVIDIEQGKTDEVYVNEKEWKIAGANEDIAEWVELDKDASEDEQMDFFTKLFDPEQQNSLDWKKFSDEEPVVSEESNNNKFYGIYVRYGYSGTNTPSSPRLINHGDKPAVNEKSQYISVDKQQVTSSYEVLKSETDENLGKLLDANARSYWQNNPKDEQKFLIYTFDEPVHLNKIEYAMGDDRGTWWGHIDEAQLEVSLDGENYKVVDDKVNWEWISGHSLYPYDLPEEEYVKYVKITPMKVYNNNSNVRVAMFNFYQDATAKTNLNDLADLIQIEEGDYTYDGEAKQPKVVQITDYDDSILKLGEDYEVAYENNVNAGTAKIKITGKGDKYEGEYVREFEIKKASAPKIQPEDNYTLPAGASLDELKLPEGWTLEDSNFAISPGETKEATLVYQGADKDNYESNKKVVQISMTAKTSTEPGDDDPGTSEPGDSEPSDNPENSNPNNSSESGGSEAENQNAGNSTPGANNNPGVANTGENMTVLTELGIAQETERGIIAGVIIFTAVVSGVYFVAKKHRTK